MANSPDYNHFEHHTNNKYNACSSTEHDGGCFDPHQRSPNHADDPAERRHSH
jgi:hypothetical protein